MASLPENDPSGTDTSQRSSQKPKTSLLPAFEPLSSSPSLPRPLKRTRDALEEEFKYPTPVPTSSTAILSSSPARQQVSRLGFQRDLSTVSERVPLSAVPTIHLDPSGKPVRMGRSSASCDYQLPANRLISRVHVEACYKPSLSRLERDRVEIKCVGWNGVKVHCQSRVYELHKGQKFTSDAKNAALMVDVHDARVMIQWPLTPHLGPLSSDEEEEASPSKRQRTLLRHSTPPSPSPVQSRRRPVSPVSPSPAFQALMPSSPPFGPTIQPPVEIYEDPEPSNEEESHVASVTQSTQVLTQPSSTQSQHPPNSATSAIEPEYFDNDEENDPIIHSFGPFGVNLLPRMASVTAGGSPLLGTTSHKTSSTRSSHTEPLAPNDSPSQLTNLPASFDLKEHVINQLAFSRLSSTPLSTIFAHLPHQSTISSPDDLRDLIKETECVGEVTREGKDAAGKVLESEFYYIPDNDRDEKRKEAVVNDLMKPGLRACRKQHKQYFWRKPKKA